MVNNQFSFTSNHFKSFNFYINTFLIALKWKAKVHITKVPIRLMSRSTAKSKVITINFILCQVFTAIHHNIPSLPFYHIVTQESRMQALIHSLVCIQVECMNNLHHILILLKLKKCLVQFKKWWAKLKKHFCWIKILFCGYFLFISGIKIVWMSSFITNLNFMHKKTWNLKTISKNLEVLFQMGFVKFVQNKNCSWKI